MMTRKAGEEGGVAGRILRRLSHVALGAIIIVYMFPERILGLPRELYIVLFFSLLPITIEYFRLKRGIIFTGLREHERGRVASYCWFTHAVVISILFFPQEIAAPVILSAAIGDPVMGEVRRLSKGAAILAGAATSFIIFYLFSYSLSLALISSFLIVLGEAVEIKGSLRLRSDVIPSRDKREIPFKTDDDFTTVLLPAVVLTVVYFFIPTLFPSPVLEPSPPFTSLP